jgi:signal transduction histidine kinase
MRPRSFYVATGLWFLVLALAVVQWIWMATTNWNSVPSSIRPDTTGNYFGLFTVLIMSSVAWLIAVRRPENKVGWLMMAIAVLGASLSIPELYASDAVYLHANLPAADWVYWASQFIWVWLFGGLLVFLPLIYPDGHLLSRRWWIPIGLFGVILLIGMLAAFDPAATAPLRNPAGIPALSGLTKFTNSGPFSLAFFVVACSGIVSLVVRYRRGDDRERQQLKWLMTAVGLLLVGAILQIVIPPLSNWPIIPLLAGCLPVAIGIAVLRYRLYDIDLIINKALVYGSLAALITALYVLVVIGVGAMVGSSRQLLLSVVTTLIVAITFQPLRQRTQRLANRLVYGKRSTPYETLSQFSEHLSETFSQEDILVRMARLLAQGTGAERAEVWVRTGHRLVLASASPALDRSGAMELPMEDGSLPVMERDTVVPVTHQAQLLGALTIIKKRGETMRPVEQKLVADLAAQAGLVLRNVGLNRELLARLEELRASRQRLVTAQDEERRRLERNLHDGAQQHLVALKVKLGLAEAASEPESKVRRMLSQLKQDADEALTTMRELARGIYPPLLVSDGLPTALQAHARRLTISVEVQAEQIPRQSRELEAAIYFCCLEALQNVTKYAAATAVSLRLWQEKNQILFTVEDNGKGFDPNQLQRISGIQNMRDRLEALGGSLTIKSAPATGTSVSGAVPMATLAEALPQPALV